MGRSILAVIVGYIATIILVTVGLAVAFIAMGVDRTYQPGTYEVSTAWVQSTCANAAAGTRPSTTRRLAIPVTTLGQPPDCLGADFSNASDGTAANRAPYMSRSIGFCINR